MLVKVLILSCQRRSKRLLVSGAEIIMYKKLQCILLKTNCLIQYYVSVLQDKQVIIQILRPNQASGARPEFSTSASPRPPFRASVPTLDLRVVGMATIRQWLWLNNQLTWCKASDDKIYLSSQIDVSQSNHYEPLRTVSFSLCAATKNFQYCRSVTLPVCQDVVRYGHAMRTRVEYEDAVPAQRWQLSS